MDVSGNGATGTIRQQEEERIRRSTEVKRRLREEGRRLTERARYYHQELLMQTGRTPTDA